MVSQVPAPNECEVSREEVKVEFKRMARVKERLVWSGVGVTKQHDHNELCRLTGELWALCVRRAGHGWRLDARGW